MYSFDEPLDTDEGWAKYNFHHWLRDYRDFLEFFLGKCFTEPHSTKQIEDGIAWALETTPETLADHDAGIGLPTGVEFTDLCARVRCPVLVMHGDEDAIRPQAQGVALAEATRGAFVSLEGSGHLPQARDPVKVNLLLRDFIAPPPPARAGCAASRAASARSTSPRRSGSATRSATPRSPTSCASSIPTSRSTGSPSIR